MLPTPNPVITGSRVVPPCCALPKGNQAEGKRAAKHHRACCLLLHRLDGGAAATVLVTANTECTE